MSRPSWPTDTLTSLLSMPFSRLTRTMTISMNSSVLDEATDLIIQGKTGLTMIKGFKSKVISLLRPFSSPIKTFHHNTLNQVICAVDSSRIKSVWVFTISAVIGEYCWEKVNSLELELSVMKRTKSSVIRVMTHEIKTGETSINYSNLRTVPCSLFNLQVSKRNSIATQVLAIQGTKVLRHGLWM